MVTASLLTVIALAVRMKVSGGAVDLVGLYTLGADRERAATLWAAGVAMRLRTMQAGPIMQMPVFLILFFAPVYVPLSLLDGWIHARRGREPADARDRVGPRLHLRRADRGGRGVRCRRCCSARSSCVWAIRGLRKAEAAG